MAATGGAEVKLGQPTQNRCTRHNEERNLMQITFDTSNAEDIAQIKVFLGLADAAVAAPAVSGEETAAPAAKKATAKKAAPAAKKATAKPEPTPEPEEAEEPEEEAEEAEDEDLLGGDDVEYTMADAVELATKLVSGGEAPRVKKALADVGAKRVSELKGADIATFVTSLQD